LALGSETNYFGMNDVAEHAFTIKNIGDAILIRDHIINMLEQAEVEHEDTNLKRTLMTFIVVGGGFSGIETVGELNDFVRDSIKHFYHNIDISDVRVILVNSGGRILPEVTEDLSEFALHKIRENGVEVLLNTRLTSVDNTGVKLSDGAKIDAYTVIWAGGGKPNPLLPSLECEHDKTGRIVTNNYLEVKGYSDGVFALGDCACIMDPNTDKPYPPTAQHAIRQGGVVANNIAAAIRRVKGTKTGNKKTKFDYKTKGMMALIGRKNGVGILMGHRVHGFVGWVIWRFYYLSTLPTVQKKLRVMVDWFIDLLFKRDVTRLKTAVSVGSFDQNMSTEGKVDDTMKSKV